MKQLTGNQVRQMFLDYFRQQGHMIEPGASLIPNNDPTLLWINAGVAALKKYFDGSEKPASNRIANAQKSIRTNDIENVGKTARHHTFFEMLGNFSIGDYFKTEAIHFAWEFLTSEEWMGIDKERLYITVYTDDLDAYNVWTKECKVDPSHVLKTDDNFWEIGKGPGGPDSEIFFDRGEKYDPEGLGEKLFFDEMENDRYVEVWNVVFSQYDCDPSIDRKDYKELPQKNIDTVKMIYEKLILAKFDRKDLLVALGGGVTGDITGFTAATYLRGIDFVQIPTSLLAQVDSSIGGKTGVDFDSYKNMVGAFHMPKLVYINVSTLTTLSDEQFISGMGEIIKHGLIKDSAYFDWLIENHDRILARDKDVLMEMIRVSCNIKRVVVENDPTEKGDRALLNFGHTLGHAIERYLDLKLSHGACVGIGCCLASVISYNRGDITEDELHKIIHAFDMFGFPTLKDYPVDADAVIEYTKNDKKMVGDKIKFILLHTIGDAYINTNVVPDDMKKAFEWH